ncbi:family 78 glycoside hydrolase catalytic domain [Botrimarina sp.]|uniref:family 78 glycoside hydrolase catalytic domain n=1 Tax=Botrimarina sp. TaxID=2795802 RepID=UPI0032ED68B6
MIRKLLASLLVVGCLLPSAPALAAGGLIAARLRCEHREDPQGVDREQPRLSWIVASDERGQRQTAYQVVVASSRRQAARGEGDLWDSGKVDSDKTLGVRYEGAELKPHQPCYWAVRVWDASGEPSEFSPPARWTVGVLSAEDWRAEWIGYDAPRDDEPALPPTRLLRTEFTLRKPVKRAIAYVTALGLPDVWLNGKRLTDDYFIPGWSDYTKRVYYRAYDATRLLREGENAAGVELADGWYAGHVGMPRNDEHRDRYGESPRFAGQLFVEYDDGSTDLLTTGDGWRVSTGGTRAADLLMGETYDARRAPDGWTEPGFDDSQWADADVGCEADPAVEWHPGQPVREIETFTPEAITEPEPGVYVLDLGQNFAGVPRLRLPLADGQRIELRHAERLNPDGTAYFTNLRAAKATDVYVADGRGVQVWQPRFTFHGFQFIEVRGLDRKPEPGEVQGVALSSATPMVGRFGCSDPMLDRLVKNAYWTQRANFIDVPTDCPQRDERLGWTGDAQVYVETATRLADVQAFFDKWLVDLTDAQRGDGQFPCVAPLVCVSDDGGPAWADAGVICPWTIYQTYGDLELLRRQYPSMKRFVDFMESRSKDGVLPPDEFHTFGDWLSINADTPKPVIYITYHACSARLLAEAAEALGHEDDAEKYRKLYERIKQAFNEEFVDDQGRVRGDTQTAYVLAIANDLVDGERLEQAADHLVDDIDGRGALSTGFIGTKDLMLVLSKIGRDDVAFDLLHNEQFPSWGFSIKHGATSIWERWDGWTPDKGFQNPGMNSFAHYSFGAVYGWMVRTLGGIRGDEPGFGRLVIAPKIDPQLQWCRTRYDSVRGPIETDWRKEGGRLVTRLIVPANTTATIELPCDDAAGATESGQPLDAAEGLSDVLPGDGVVRFTAGGGVYDFSTPYSP